MSEARIFNFLFWALSIALVIAAILAARAAHWFSAGLALFALIVLIRTMRGVGNDTGAM